MKENGRHHLTKEGLEKIKQELEKLITVDRPRVIKDLQAARAQGDLSENADYDAAREEQAHLEGRIKRLENVIKNVVLIDTNSNNNNSNLGKEITIKLANGRVQTFKLLGSLESNPLENIISNESPLGVALLHAKKGESVLVRTDKGNEFTVDVIDIK